MCRVIVQANPKWLFVYRTARSCRQTSGDRAKSETNGENNGTVGESNRTVGESNETDGEDDGRDENRE